MPVPVPVSSDTSTAPKNIWVAAGEGDLERVRHLIEVEGLSPTIADQWTYTPIHAAASYGKLDVLRYLLTHPSAPTNAVETTDDDGDTALFVVEDVRTARCLVEDFHANAKHENKEGNTAAATAEENENEEVAAYLRSVTGEEPMYQRLSDLAEQDGDEANVSSAMDEAIDQQTDAMMSRVQEILLRAQQRGASSGQELTDEEEAELRTVVGQSVLTQIREGWGQAGNEGDGPAGILENVEAIEVDNEADRIAPATSHPANHESPPRR